MQMNAQIEFECTPSGGSIHRTPTHEIQNGKLNNVGQGNENSQVNFLTDKQLETSTALLHILSHSFNWCLIGAENRTPFNCRYLKVPSISPTSFIWYSLAAPANSQHFQNDSAMKTSNVLTYIL